MVGNPASTASAFSRWLMGAVCLASSAAVFFAVPAQAQFGFDSWTTGQGLPQNSIHAILQTRDSYLWLTTSDGLVRFDGVRFTVFNKGNSPGIRSNRFTALYQDRDGDLWIGTESAGVTRYHGGTFTTYTFREEEAAGSQWVIGITGDSSGHLWVLLRSRVMCWNGAGFNPAAPSKFPHNKWVQFSMVARGDRGGFWSPSPTAVSLFIRGQAYLWNSHDGLSGSDVRAVAEDEHATIWTATRPGLIEIKQGQRPRLSIPTTVLPGTILTFISSPEMKVVCKDRRGGFATVSLASRETHWLPNPPPDLLTDLGRAVFYEDRENNLWIGTYARGLYRAQKQAVTVYSKAQGLRDHNIYPIYQDHRGAVWMGAWPSTLARWDSGTVTNYTKRDGLSGEEITALYEDRSGRLWVGAYGENNGLRVLQGRRFVVPSGFGNLGIVSAIYEDRQGALWFGTEEHLVRYWRGKFSSFTTKDGLAGNDVRVIFEDANGDLWFGGGGLTRLHQGKFVAFKERDGLPSDSVRALYGDLNGVLWIGTYDGGLGRLKDGKFTTYTMREGLFSNGVFQILEDGRGDLWMSSNQGIYRVHKRELNDFAAGKTNTINSIAYGKSDGMLNVECNGNRSPAGIKTRDGKLWFPTQDGVSVIDPVNVRTNPQAPPVMIESVLIDRRPARTDRDVEVKSGPDSFEIQYTALSFINSDRIKFKYKLAGLDGDWIDAGTRRTAYYSHVPPGKYVFRVIATNSDGVWNTEGKSLALTVLPPFYETRLFGTIVFLSMLGFVCLIWRYRVAQLIRVHAAQQAFTRQLISSQETERKRIAAELHDSLGQHLVVIKNLALIALNNGMAEGTVRPKMDEISAEASHALAQVREISYNLRPYQLDRIGLTKAIEAIVAKASSATTIQFRMCIDDIDGVLQRGSEINFYRIVQECINNVVKHSQATVVDVTVRRTAAGLLLNICDNGRGFTRGAVDSNPSGGFGLTGIRERAELLGGRPSIQSAPGHGTTISVEIPGC